MVKQMMGFEDDQDALIWIKSRHTPGELKKLQTLPLNINFNDYYEPFKSIYKIKSIPFAVVYNEKTDKFEAIDNKLSFEDEDEDEDEDVFGDCIPPALNFKKDTPSKPMPRSINNNNNNLELTPITPSINDFNNNFNSIPMTPLIRDNNNNNNNSIPIAPLICDNNNNNNSIPMTPLICDNNKNNNSTSIQSAFMDNNTNQPRPNDPPFDLETFLAQDDSVTDIKTAVNGKSGTNLVYWTRYIHRGTAELIVFAAPSLILMDIDIQPGSRIVSAKFCVSSVVKPPQIQV